MAFDDEAVAHRVDPIAGFGDGGVVGHKQQGFAFAADEIG
jgi:hypothetical protein